MMNDVRMNVHSSLVVVSCFTSPLALAAFFLRFTTARAPTTMSAVEMNLVLLEASDFVDTDLVELSGRRFDHIRQVQRPQPGDSLVVGIIGGRIGDGVVERWNETSVVMRVKLHRHPPPPLDLTLVLALPRPKVLNRVIAAATSMGVKHIALVNSWRVEKSYWKTPRLDPANLRRQCMAGLEQARDTLLPSITQHRFFRRFVEEDLSRMPLREWRLVAHPPATRRCPRAVPGGVTLAIGPEGGFIEAEIASFEEVGFRPVTIGDRTLRVETAVAALIALVSPQDQDET